MNKYNYTNPFSYKLIYIFRINDDQHSGIPKVGDTSINYAGSPDDLTPYCELLNKAAKERINQYTRTAGIKYELLYTELAFYKGSDGKNYAFIDKKLHKVLTNSGIQKVELYGAQEWFKTDLKTVKNAIAALKAGRKSLSSTEISEDKKAPLCCGHLKLRLWRKPSNISRRSPISNSCGMQKCVSERHWRQWKWQNG